MKTGRGEFIFDKKISINFNAREDIHCIKTLKIENNGEMRSGSVKVDWFDLITWEGYVDFVQKGLVYYVFNKVG